MRIVVTGGRGFDDYEMLDRTLSLIHAEYGISTLIHGGATGADTMAGQWAEQRGIEVLGRPANWKRYGRSAGPIRNREMLREKPDACVAFPGGSGTRDMIDVATKAGIPVIDAVEYLNAKEAKRADAGRSPPMPGTAET